jgi:nitrogen fixation/metabolism regulation signal transduction histidine kinase
VSFLLLASVPALLVSFIASQRISTAVERLQNPGVQASVTHAPRLYRELVDRWRVNADPLLEALPARFPESSEALVRRLIEESELSFAVWERDPRVIAWGDVRADDLPAEEDWAALSGEGSPPTLRGRSLRFFHAGDDGGPGRAVGVVLSEELALAMGSVGRDYGRYLQLGPVEEIQKRLVWLTSAAIFLLAAGSATWVARVTARRISRPVTELARAADRVAAGDLSHRAEIHADGEIGDLVTAFNRMTGRLERSREELLRVERIAAWRDVAQRIAHEIRNPLTPVRLAVHRLRSRLPGDAEAAESLRSIGEEVENLSRISESFSEFAKMPEAKFARTDLAQVARSVRELFREPAPGVEVAYEGPASLPLVADRDQLRRAATNLVKNAAEAMAGAGLSGTIRLRVAQEAGRALLEVEDPGPGIPETLRAQLFRPGASGRPGGSGLGLAMVHRIATDHQGTLRWIDRKPGSRFVVEIPLDLPESA